MQSNKADREQICAYVNDILGNYGPAKELLPITPDNYLDALHDGIILCYLVNVLSTSGPIIKESELRRNRATVFHKMDQVNQALDATKKIGIDLINIRSEYIVQKKQNTIIGLFNQIKRQKPGPKPQVKKSQSIRKVEEPTPPVQPVREVKVQRVPEPIQKEQKIQIIQQKPVQQEQGQGFLLNQSKHTQEQTYGIQHPQQLKTQKPSPQQPQQASPKQFIQKMQINQNQKIYQQAQNGYNFEKVVGLQAVVLVGSLRKGSVNRGIVNSLTQIKSRKFMQFMHFHIPDLGILPIYNHDIISEGRIPKAVHDLRQIIRQSSGVIIATPEYNGTFSGIIKNAFDWVSDSWPNSPSPLTQKKVGIVSASYLTENQIRDIRQMGDYIKPNYFKQSFYINLRSGPFNMQTGKLVNGSQVDRLAYWYQDFSYFLLSGLPNPQPFPRFIMTQ